MISVELALPAFVSGGTFQGTTIDVDKAGLARDRDLLRQIFPSVGLAAGSSLRVRDYGIGPFPALAKPVCPCLSTA